MSPEKSVLATDWDDVCYEFVKYYFPYYNRLHGTDFKPHQVVSHDFSLLFKQDAKHIQETVDGFHESAESVEHGLIDSTREVLPVLAEAYDIVVITARKSRFKVRVQDMVDSYIPGSIIDMYFREDIEKEGSKGKLARRLGAVALVDDHVQNIFSAEAEGVRGLLRNMPKNYYQPLAVERVGDWYEVYEKLTGQPFSAHHDRS